MRVKSESKTPRAKTPPTTIRGHVVSHTHWDRAWYMPFEAFRLRLIQVLDEVLEVLETDKDFKYFVFDGQIVPIEDYLEVRPSQRGRIERLARKGKLVLGPHYILPDEFLVSGEALIRNLLLGRKVTAAFATPSRAGYMPDTFGHVSQIPQILNGFGLDSFLFMRGVDWRVRKLGLEFLWRGADGESEVLAVNLSPNYSSLMSVGYAYNDQMFQPYSATLACQKADKMMAHLAKRTRGRVVLLNNGSDHKHVQRNLPAILRDINAHAAGRYQLAQSTYDRYLSDFRRQKLALRSYQGELRGALERYILSGVLSTRLYLKQANFESQRLLEGYVEPLAALLSLEGYAYPADEIHYAWKTLLKNHPHDDICGCSVDEVHNDMMNRFQHVDQVGEILRDRALDNLLFQVKLPPPEAGTPVLLYNPLPWERSAAIRALVDLPAEAAGDTKRLELVDSKGRDVPAAFALTGKPYMTDWAWDDEMRREVRVEFLARDLPAAGYEMFLVRPATEAESSAPAVASATPASPEAPVRTIERGLENDFIRVETRPDGSLEIRDAKNGMLLARTNFFEDCADRGDEYDFDPVQGDTPIQSTGKGLSWSIVQRNPERLEARLEQVLDIPLQLEGNRSARSVGTVEIPLRTGVTLYADSPRVDLRVTFVNHARDHRLRLGVEVPGKTDKVWVEGKFDVAARPIGAADEQWMQRPMPTAPQDGWAALDTGSRGVAIFNRGLPEYEVQSSLGSMRYWVTIMRSCGWLSRGDLGVRPANAGPESQTPGAQCPGEHHAEVSVFPYEGDWQKAGVARAAQEYLTPPATWGFFHKHRAHRGTHDLPMRHSFVSVEPAPLLVSAFKKAESGKGCIVRVWNPGTRSRRAVARFDRPLDGAWRVRLDEKRLAKLPVVGPRANRLEFEVKPKQIVTVELAFKAVHPR